MSKQDLLISRLNEIGSSLARSEKAVALIGLGSAGVELDRLDNYSDLDFFAVVEVGFKREFLDSLVWLSSICPIAYSFRNTPDGYEAPVSGRSLLPVPRSLKSRCPSRIFGGVAAG